MTVSINDRSLWDGRLDEDWDTSGSPRQREFLACVAVRLPPQWFRDRPAKKRLTLWGRAEGSGTAVPPRVPSPGRISGIDFSTVAISVATAMLSSIAFSAVCLTDNSTPYARTSNANERDNA